MKEQVLKFLRDEEGLTTVEYAIAGGVIATGVIALFTEIGQEVLRRIGVIHGEMGAGDA